jgi:hypothetical protein
MRDEPRARRDAFLHKIKSRLVFIVTFFVAGKVFFVTALVAANLASRIRHRSS